MRAALAIALVVAGLMVMFIYDDLHAAKTRAAQPKVFNCRAPTREGNFTIITVTWRNGALAGDCDYLISQFSSKGG